MRSYTVVITRHNKVRVYGLTMMLLFPGVGSSPEISIDILSCCVAEISLTLFLVFSLLHLQNLQLSCGLQCSSNFQLPSVSHQHPLSTT